MILQSLALSLQDKDLVMNTLNEAGNAMLLAHEGQRQIAEMIIRGVKTFFNRFRVDGNAAPAAASR